MKQLLKKIIVSVIMIAIFLAPVSGGIKNKTVLAQSIDYSNLFPGSYAKFHSASSSSAQFEVQIIGKQSDWEKTAFVSVDVAGLGIIGVNPNSTVLVVMENGNFISSYDLSGEVRNHTTSAGIPIVNRSYIGQEKIGGEKNFFPVSNPPLQPEKNYTVALYIKSISEGAGNGIDLFGSSDKSYYKFGTSDTFSTPPIDGPLTGDNPTEAPNASGSTSVPNFGCDYNPSTWFSNCIAYFLYTVVFQSVAELTKLAAKILDFFVYYSTNDSSYRSEFVTKAWGAVRDVANIFFIIALLYVALKTILGLNVTDNKKLISAVILVALIINFSLFTTKVVIDASNILAKVFYNNITSKDANAQNADGTLKDSEAGVGGQKSISIGIVDKFNPQGLVTQENYTDNPYTFIFMVILLIAVTLYTAYIFFSVALLFVARVVSLWISMIFSPIAFASYTVPFEIPGFGHKEWWKGLLENAFLAPLFIFFLYIIILFTGFLGKIISYTDSPDLDTMANLMQRIMSVTIPFVIIVMLLTKAKKLAVKLSGDMGAMINKIGAVAGGLALGAATGGTALAARTVIGGGGGYFAGQAAKGAEKMGLKRTAGVLKDVGKFAQKSSFDLRGVKVAGQSLGSITGMKLGETQKGGWTEMKKRQVEKKQKRAEELKQRETSEEKKEVDNAEIKLKDETIKIIDPKILRPEFSELGGLTAKAAMEAIDKKMDKARIDLNDAKNAGDLTGVADAKRDLDNAKKQKDEIRDQNSISSGGTGSIKDFEGDIRKAKDKLLIKEEKTLINYTSKISSEWNKIPNQIFRLGAYSRAGADEAVRKIRTGTKLDSGE